MRDPHGTHPRRPVNVSVLRELVEMMDREAEARGLTRSRWWEKVLAEKAKRLQSARK